MLTRLTAKQLRQPSGIIGHYFGHAMNRLNQNMNEMAIHQLKVESDHRVLDIGFGGGRSLELLGERILGGQIHGVEISKTMLNRASRKFRELLTTKRLVLTQAGVTELPFEDGFFDRVCTVNTLYFWPDTQRGFHEIHRVLGKGGRFALCYRPRDVMEKLSFTQFEFDLFEMSEVDALLTAQGFRIIEHTVGRDAHLGYACAVASKEGIE